MVYKIEESDRGSRVTDKMQEQNQEHSEESTKPVNDVESQEQEKVMGRSTGSKIFHWINISVFSLILFVGVFLRTFTLYFLEQLFHYLSDVYPDDHTEYSFFYFVDQARSARSVGHWLIPFALANISISLFFLLQNFITPNGWLEFLYCVAATLLLACFCYAHLRSIKLKLACQFFKAFFNETRRSVIWGILKYSPEKAEEQ